MLLKDKSEHVSNSHCSLHAVNKNNHRASSKMKLSSYSIADTLYSERFLSAAYTGLDLPLGLRGFDPGWKNRDPGWRTSPKMQQESHFDPRS